jgi:DNA-binding NtrC family response regulator
MVIDDEQKHRELYSAALRDANFAVETISSAEDAFIALQTIHPDMIISDVKMPGMNGISFLHKIRVKFPDLPFLLVTAFADIRDAVKALKLGAVDYLEKPIDLDELQCAVNDALHIQKDDNGNSHIPQDLTKGIIAESLLMRSILDNAYKVAQSDATVLLTGESGTGKEVLASFIHQASGRKDAPMVALNCAAIPANILASELFGHKKGAFTGAVSNRDGIFLAADKGTLFLDEIGDMPLELQPSLLRAIETGMVSPVGSDSETKVNLRLIAATNTNLEEAVKAGRFRGDLFYRLNVIAFELPPLRERIEDIIPLAHFFLAQKSVRDKRFSQAATKLLRNYPWPGNARELANAVERASIISNTDIILPEHLPPVIAATKPRFDPGDTQTGIKTMNQVEITAIKEALEQVNDNRTKAAELLGISRRALIYKIKRYGL